MRTELAVTEGETVVVQDTLADGLVLDLESVKLYQGVTPPVNKLNDTTHVYTPVINAGEALEVQPQFDAVLNRLEVPLPARRPALCFDLYGLCDPRRGEPG